MHDDPGNQPGPHVAKGAELGYFQFGGSTYCLVLRPGGVSDIVIDALSGAHGSNPPLIWVGSKLLRTNASRP